MAHTLVTLRADCDAVRLQRLLERCSDYYELHEGWPTPADAGEYELTLDPKAPQTSSLLVLALENEDQTVDAVVQVIIDAPEPGTWWIGLLIVAPELRSRGVGAELVRQTLAAATEAGAGTMKLAVSLRNPRGQRFWERTGFRDTEKVYSVSTRSGHADQGRIMVREVL